MSPLRLAAGLTLAALALNPAFSQTVADPANLTGEHVTAQSLADTLPIDHGAPALEQLLRKLRTRASLMLIVAHPDDEDGGMLTFESRGQGARVAMLTLNRGEGGQNAITGDFNDALGLIRTQELLAADRYMGVDQMFGTVADFGFSKTKEESFAKWGHDRVLYDAVRAVRLYRPLVVASVFIGGVTDGHGQHQVAGEIAQEVFTAAADPKVFPEMGLAPWAPLKVYGRVPFARIDEKGMFDYATGKFSPPRFYNYVTKVWSTSTPKANVTIHEGDRDPALGMSYIQWARQGLSLQKSQMGPQAISAPAGAFDSGYTRYGARIQSGETEQSFFDGIDISLAGIANLAPEATATLREALVLIDVQLSEAQKAFTLDHPEATAPALATAFRLLNGLIEQTSASKIDGQQRANVLHELRVKHVQLNQALGLAYGLSATSSLEDAPKLLTTATSATIKTKVDDGGNTAARLTNYSIQVTGAKSGELTDHRGEVSPHTSSSESVSTLPFRTVPPATRPYFSRPNLEQPYYDLSAPELRNAPQTPDPISVSIEAHPFGAGARPAEPKLVLATAASLSGSGGPAVVVPPLSVSLSPAVGVVSPGGRTLTVTAHLRSETTAGQEGTLKLDIPPGWKVTPESAHWTLAAGAKETAIPFTLSFAPAANGTVFHISAHAVTKDHDYTEGFRPIGYPGLTYTNLYTPAVYKAVAVDFKIAPGLKVAYLSGTGDQVAEFLPNLGITPVVLTVSDLTAAKLSKFDAVILGVRAYSAHAELRGAGGQALIDFAKAGGTVIVQYHSASFKDSFGPYPISVGTNADNVLDETAAVTFLKPDSPVFTTPNRITARDFEGWVEERGHGFATDFDPHFQALVETHDPDQDPERGSLLYAPVGKGAWVYDALALYRQLPEGVPGAYRLLANLLSLKGSAK